VPDPELIEELFHDHKSALPLVSVDTAMLYDYTTQ
jgi:hypothetical protein